MLPRVAWAGPTEASEKGAACSAGGSQRVLDVCATAVLSASLLWAPGIFCLLAFAVVWKGELNLWLHLLLMALLLLVMCCPCCPLCLRRCRGGDDAASGPLRWLEGRKWVMAVFLLLGWLAFVLFFACLYHTDLTTPTLRAEYDASLPVAVIGAGASGLSSSWVLAKGGRSVTVFESLGDIGGHSLSYVDASDGRNLTVDLGFIFNNAAAPAYVSYKSFGKHFGRTLVSTALNTSGYFDGEYWDNTGDPDRFDLPLREEVRRFMDHVNSPESTLKYLAPLGWWLWYHGFSDRFRRLCLDSTMSVLFVTKMGLDKQSAQGVLNYFRIADGFTHLRYDVPKVQYSPGGSQFMWKDVVRDMESTGRAQVRVNSRVAEVEKEDGLWTVTLADGTKYGGFGDVVLACPSNVAAKIVRNRPLQALIVSQIDYIAANVTLHKDHLATVGSNFRQASDDVLYFVSDDHLTGKIGRIFGDVRSDLLLTVHGQGQEAVKIDPAKTLWKTTWSHHYFSIFELCIARKFVPMFNNGGGLHYAGDWVYGVGHNDAIKSGVHAACAVGVPETPPDGASDPLYSDLIRATCRLPS